MEKQYVRKFKSWCYSFNILLYAVAIESCKTGQQPSGLLIRAQKKRVLNCVTQKKYWLRHGIWINLHQIETQLYLKACSL